MQNDQVIGGHEEKSFLAENVPDFFLKGTWSHVDDHASKVRRRKYVFFCPKQYSRDPGGYVVKIVMRICADDGAYIGVKS